MDSSPTQAPSTVPPPSGAQAIQYESEVAKLEEDRIAGLESQATAILGLVVAIAAFAASALNTSTLEESWGWIGAVAAAMFLAAGFAIAARGPRALGVRFWEATNAEYAALEERLKRAEEAVGAASLGAEGAEIVECWRARRAVSSYLAERKALWLTCALLCLLLAFVAAAVAAYAITT